MRSTRIILVLVTVTMALVGVGAWSIWHHKALSSSTKANRNGAVASVSRSASEVVRGSSASARQQTTSDRSAFASSVVRGSPDPALAPNRRSPLSTVPDAPLLTDVPRARTLPPTVRPIVDREADVEFSERMRAVHALKPNLTSEEIAPLYEYLLAPSSAAAPDRQQENWLRNDIMDKLVEQATVPEGLSDMLVSVYQDRQQDVVMRDYAVQHLTPLYTRADSKEQAVLKELLWQATEETESSIAGTALLAWLEVSGVASAVSADEASVSTSPDRAQLAQAALRLASDEHCGELARISALSVCGRMGLKEALPVVIQLAQSAASIPVRLAAIGALGDLGTPGAQAVLERVLAENHPRLRPAAQAALQRLRNRS